LVGPVAEPLLAAASDVLENLLPLTSGTLHEYLMPANGPLHLPITGDLLTALLGEKSLGEHGLLGPVLGNSGLVSIEAVEMDGSAGVFDDSVSVGALGHFHL
jgi:hypothetical protein